MVSASEYLFYYIRGAPEVDFERIGTETLQFNVCRTLMK